MAEQRRVLRTQLDSLHLSFKGLRQEVLTRSLYPEVVTAQGPISGKITLGGQTDTLAISADGPGKLKIAPATARH